MDVDSAWTTEALETLVYTLLSDQTEYLTDHYADLLLTALDEDPTLQSVYFRSS